ncbi:hypothetical protein LZ31DRAFT_222699 [Colletotrichum somersetense]|nr:hypothetical protein LZ31DRAFT_222699 [Colletotrichum somersetense]
MWAIVILAHPALGTWMDGEGGRRRMDLGCFGVLLGLLGSCSIHDPPPPFFLSAQLVDCWSDSLASEERQSHDTACEACIWLITPQKRGILLYLLGFLEEVGDGEIMGGGGDALSCGKGWAVLTKTCDGHADQYRTTGRGLLKDRNASFRGFFPSLDSKVLLLFFFSFFFFVSSPVSGEKLDAGRAPAWMSGGGSTQITTFTTK